MPTSHLELVRANFTRRTDIQGQLREIDEAATTENRSYTESESDTINSLREELRSVDERITTNLELEVRSQEIEAGLAGMFGTMLDRETGETLDTRSVGQQFVASEEYRAFADAGAQGNRFPSVMFDGIEFRAVTDATVGPSGGGSGNTSAGALTRPERISRVGRDFLDRRVYLLDLLPHVGTTQGAVEYVQDSTPLADMANKAVETAEQGQKPQAGITLSVKNEPMATIPAWVNLTRQAAADVPQVQGYLDGRLRYSLKRRSDLQSINGNGTSPNLRGLLQRSGILTYAPGGAEARYKSIRHGIRLMEDAEAVPEIIVLNPADAELFDLSNDTSAGLHANPDFNSGLSGSPTRTAWGLTQVRSTAIASGTAMLVDPMAVSVFDRQQPTAYMTDSHGSNFTANILTLLLECRIGLALFDPNGVLSITFNGTT